MYIENKRISKLNRFTESPLEGLLNNLFQIDKFKAIRTFHADTSLQSSVAKIRIKNFVHSIEYNLNKNTKNNMT